MNESKTSPDAGKAPVIGDEEIEILYSMAHHLHTGGMRAKAHELFALVAAYRPRSVRYNKALGISLMGNGEYEKAIPVLAAAMLCNAETDHALSVAFAECLALTSRRPQALRLFQKAKVSLEAGGDCAETERLRRHTERWLTVLNKP